MAKISLKNTDGKDVGSVELDDAVWAQDVNEHLLWEAVKWQQAKRRAGTHSTKTVAEVSGGGKKPFRQKGTGNARQGSSRSPQHVGGGKVFGPHPRDYEYQLPKKVRKGALRSALSLRLKEQKVIVLDEWAVKDAKVKLTQQVAATLATLGVGKVLIVDGKENESLARGSRNLPKAKWLAPEGLNVYDVLNHETLIITRDSAKLVETALKAK